MKTRIAVLIVLLVGGAGCGWLLLHSGGAHRVDRTDRSYDVVRVARRTLSVGSTLTGTIGYGTPALLPVRAAGTVTWLPETGAVMSRGDVLMRVDDRPVVLMYGGTPAYRPMLISDPVPTADAPAAPLVGPDVEQLEANLAAMGYRGFDVDGEFTSATEAAVKAWQRDLGVAQTGHIELGAVLFVSGPIRVVPDPSALGTESATSAVQQTSTTKVITVSAPAADLGWATPGTRVTVTVPSQRTLKATVTNVGSSADEAGNVMVRLTMAHPKRAPRAGSVTVSYVAQRRTNVLAVPVPALVALAEGGYGLQLADAAFVPVEPGLYAEGFVEVSGDITDGAEIRVPR